MKIHKGEKTALIFGATGLVGSHLLDFLLMHGAYNKVISFGRRELETTHPKLTHHVIDFDDPDSFIDLIKGDDLFCCLGTTMAKAGSKEAFFKVDFIYAYRVARLGHKNRVSQFLLISSVGADKDSYFYYSRVKGEIEEAVINLSFWSTHIFRPSVLLGNRPENRWGEQIAGKIGSVIDRFSGGLLTKYKPIEADIVAKAMVNAAQKIEKGVHVYRSEFLQELSERVNEE